MERTVKANKSKENAHAPLIWQRLEKVREQGHISYRAIVREAMKLADAGGLKDVSMRRLATRLDAGTMSVYRYVNGKNDLWDLILDEAFGEIPVPKKVSKDWRRDISRVFAATRRVMLEHPWLAALLTSRPALGPNYLRWFEFLLGATKAPHRDVSTRVRMIGTVWAFTSGSVAYEVAERENDRRNKLTPASKRAAAGPHIAGLVATGEFPHFAEYLKGPAHEPTDEDFRFGLRVVLDGLAVSRRV